jgi:hypothetical protein
LKTTILLAALSICTFANVGAAAAAAHSPFTTTTMPEGLRAAVDKTLSRDAATTTRISRASDASKTERSIFDTLTWTEQDVVASDGAWDDRFGTSVAVSGDIAVIGAFDAKIGDNYSQGAAYVFAKQDGVWTQTQKLVASDGAGMANFGAAVAITGGTILISAVYAFSESDGIWTETQKLAADDGGSGDAFGNAIATDGSIALIAAKGATINGNTLQGKVYVFSVAGGTWTQNQALTADDGASNDLLGTSLALNGDIAIIGAPTLTYNFLHAGWAYVFTASGGTWTQTQKIFPDNSAVGDQFGYAVGFNGDTALITSTGNQSAHGAAYAFKYNGGNWTQTQQFGPSDSASGDEFGNVLAMAGSSAVIGAQRLVIDDHQGAAYVFSESDGVWSQTQEFTETAGTSLDFFGGAVAFDGTTVLVGTPGATVADAQFQGAASFYSASGDSTIPPPQEVIAGDGTAGDEFGISVDVQGTTALVGAAYENSGQGAVYVFTESNGVWSEAQKLTSSDGAANDWFGQSVALDGDTAVVGAPQYLNFGNGAAYVFTRSGTTWSEAQKLAADDGVGRDQFGISVAVDGTHALVGAYGASLYQGAAYAFTGSGSTWAQTQKLVASDAAMNADFSVSVALQGNTAILGAYGDSSYQGAAYVFSDAGGTWTQAQKLVASDGAADAHFGISVALDGNNALVGAEGATVGGNSHQGAAYTFSASGSNWGETQKLTSSNGVAWDYFGRSVGLDGATAIVGAYGPNALQGAGYLFANAGGAWSETQALIAGDGASGDQFGIMVALSGSTALVGANGANGFQGAAYFYTLPGLPPGDTIFANGFDP